MAGLPARVLVSCLFAAGLGTAVDAHAQAGTGTIRVATTGADVAGCGSIATPCASLQFAVDQFPLPGAGTILVAGGTYTSTDPNRIVRVTQRQITMQGGYAADFASSDPSAYPVTIDGGNARKGFLVDCPMSPAAPCVLTLSGVTITHCSAPPDTGLLDAYGGALDAYLATIALTDVNVVANKAQGLDSGTGLPGTGGGGGLSFRTSTATLTRVQLTGNVAQGGNGSGSALRGGLGTGGGVYSFTSTVSMSQVTGTGNRASAGAAPNGVGSDQSGQRADGLGGFWALIYGSATVDRLTAAQNRAEGGIGSAQGGLALGGAIFLQLVTNASITSASLHDNVALGGSGGANLGAGGAIFAEDTDLQIQQAALVANLAQGGDATGVAGGTACGGGIYMNSVQPQATSLQATNVVIGRNTVTAGMGSPAGYAFGGGIFLQCPGNSCSSRAPSASNALVLQQATVADNVVAGGDYNQGAALYVNYFTTADSSFGIVSGHATPPRPGYYLGEAILSLGATAFHHTLWNGNPVQSTTANGGTFTDDDPHGGSPDYVAPLASPPDYHILATSAARDQAAGSTTPVDIDGQTRPNPDTGIPDLGGDEFYVPEPGTELMGATALAFLWARYTMRRSRSGARAERVREPH